MSEEIITSDILPIEQIKVESHPYDTDDSVSDELENSQVRIATDWKQEFVFIENELYHFLNSTLEGKVLLGIYQRTGTLDYTRLKKLIIYKEIEEDPVNYKIKTDVFLKLKEQAKELFPTEDPDRFYISSQERGQENKSNRKYHSTGGSFYNFYKVVRKELRSAGIYTKK
ncbi:uncharacterized protein LOC122505258 isoform X2 [Leptopilina heterotoma]|uniref:uncharacterized protein LOC122505258 isoform X2 n=1 Tax=Leptopilina heterotoma TaxID=63436 RepID=UPI001CA86EA3|nr:uncharacterized protein LOC122505258 isoform X2 [Leptopilina heterotoma]